MSKSYFSLLILALTGLFSGGCSQELGHDTSIIVPTTKTLRADDLRDTQRMFNSLGLYVPEENSPFVVDFGIFRTATGALEIGLGGVREYEEELRLRGQDPWVDDPGLPLLAKEFTHAITVPWRRDRTAEVEQWLLEHFTGADGLDLRLSTTPAGEMIVSARERPQIAEEVEVLDPIFFFALALSQTEEE